MACGQNVIHKLTTWTTCLKLFNLDAKYTSTDKQETLNAAAKDILS